MRKRDLMSVVLAAALTVGALAVSPSALAAEVHDPTAILTTKTLRSLPPLPETDHIEPTGHTREFTLVAKATEWELVEGVTTHALGFNGTTPGPTIRVTEGDLVRITVVNELNQPTSVHWHGLHVPFGMDGVPPFTQDEIAPGASFTYEFLANHAGTFMYHSHASRNSVEQNDLGLYGIFIIDPQDPTGHPEYDKEFALMIGGWMVDDAEHEEDAHEGSDNMVGMHMSTMMPQMSMHQTSTSEHGASDAGGGHSMDYSYWTINGKAFPDTEPMVVSEGDWVRIRITNITNAYHPMHLHGHDFRLIAEDGHPVAQPRIINTLDVAPGKTYEIDFVADNPGIWLFHCHELHHTMNDGVEPGGLIMLLQYEGYQAIGTSSHDDNASVDQEHHTGH